jgi:hypothetical protein
MWKHRRFRPHLKHGPYCVMRFLSATVMRAKALEILKKLSGMGERGESGSLFGRFPQIEQREQLTRKRRVRNDLGLYRRLPMLAAFRRLLPSLSGVRHSNASLTDSLDGPGVPTRAYHPRRDSHDEPYRRRTAWIVQATSSSIPGDEETRDQHRLQVDRIERSSGLTRNGCRAPSAISGPMRCTCH